MKSQLEFWLEIKKMRDLFYNARGHDKDRYEAITRRLASDYKFIYGEKFDVNKKPEEN